MTLGYVNLPEAGEQVDRAGRRRVLAVDQARDDLAAARRPHHDGAGTLDRWPGQRGVVGEGRRLAEERADAGQSRGERRRRRREARVLYSYDRKSPRLGRRRVCSRESAIK